MLREAIAASSSTSSSSSSVEAVDAPSFTFVAQLSALLFNAHKYDPCEWGDVVVPCLKPFLGLEGAEAACKHYLEK